MLKLATTLLGLTLTLGSAQAQETERLQFPLGASCDATENLREFLKRYGEKPFASSEAIVRGINGEHYRGRMVIYVNPETYSTTAVIEFPQDDMTCILSMGEQFGPVIQDPAI